MYPHNSRCVCISCLFNVEISSNFQYVKGVTALNRPLEGTFIVLETWQETSGLWDLGRCHKHLGLCNRHINCIVLQNSSAVK